eukprot:485853-Prorocentrum_minimum.AAC.1
MMTTTPIKKLGCEQMCPDLIIFPLECPPAHPLTPPLSSPHGTPLYLQEDPDAMDGNQLQAMEKERSIKRLQTLFQIPGGSGEDLGE